MIKTKFNVRDIVSGEDVLSFFSSFNFMNGVGGYMRACCAILTNLLLINPHVEATPAVVDHIGHGVFDWFYMTQQQWEDGQGDDDVVP